MSSMPPDTSGTSHNFDLQLDSPCRLLVHQLDEAQRLHTKWFLLVTVVHVRPAKKQLRVSREHHEPYVAGEELNVSAGPGSHHRSRQGNLGLPKNSRTKRDTNANLEKLARMHIES